MKAAVFALICLAAGACCATAIPTDLSGGVLIAHYESHILYTIDPPANGWCGAIEQHPLMDFPQQVNRIDITGDVGRVWCVIAAWTEEKDWCGQEMGLQDFDANAFAFVDYGACFPPEGGLTIPTPGWPAPGEGISFVSQSGGFWSGNFMPVYFFTGYAYAAYAPFVMQLGASPASGFGGFGNCLNPPELYEAACFGGLGVNMDGTYCEPPVPQPKACCFPDVHCELLLEEECEAAGGVFVPEFDYCEPNPCDTAYRICCFPNGDCSSYDTQEECEAAGGSGIRTCSAAIRTRARSQARADCPLISFPASS
jgi:hypothetical protein